MLYVEIVLASNLLGRWKAVYMLDQVVRTQRQESQCDLPAEEEPLATKLLLLKFSRCLQGGPAAW